MGRNAPINLKKSTQLSPGELNSVIRNRENLPKPPDRGGSVLEPKSKGGPLSPARKMKEGDNKNIEYGLNINKNKIMAPSTISTD